VFSGTVRAGLATVARAVLYIQVHDAKAASYGVHDAKYALQQLAQTTMRSELGKMSLDSTFAERERLNTNIVKTINDAARTWGIKCLRYEIRDILPPASVRVAMDMQAEAERRRRAEITEADGRKQALILQAQAEAQSIYARAEASAESIKRTAHAVVSLGGPEAVSVRLAEQYIQAFGELAKKGNTMLLPSNAGDPASMVAQAMGVYDSVKKHMSRGSPSNAPPSEAPEEGTRGAEAEPAEPPRFDSAGLKSSDDYDWIDSKWRN
jgi:regulator of protease activity HflC (stomatin/prohibitin superfamily)